MTAEFVENCAESAEKKLLFSAPFWMREKELMRVIREIRGAVEVINH